ncbi:hypothetical protein [Coxiella burnetii]|nr:hypothetical protein [Coxiella burnetii]
MKDLTTGQTLPDVSVNWNSSSTVSALAAGHQFLLTADQLAGNGICITEFFLMEIPLL